MKKIMLVDDVGISNFIMKRMITKISSDFAIFDYTIPASAMSDLEEINPDLIFLDLNMPVINGWKFLDLMRENGYENVVYILTSSTSELDRQKSKQYSNVKDFLIKPVDKTVLANALNSIIF